MKTLADRKQQMLEGRLQMLKGQGGNGSDPLEAARDAISRGADPEAVRQRLIDNGIDPAGL
jgi:NAD(P)H-hydrate repair Nnr-like enzyme with NAD(P)H-hydrate epimerase domain